MVARSLAQLKIELIKRKNNNNNIKIFKMKSSIELKELRNDIISKLEVIKETATAEERDLTSDENNDMDYTS